MPTTNLRKHTIPSGSDKSFNRATIFEAFGNSIHDIVPVANSTERAQLVTAMNSRGVGPSASNPLVVYRADAPGLHRLEYSTDGTVWLSDVLYFASKTAADSFGASYGGLLTIGDEARVGADRYRWSGTAWVATRIVGSVTRSPAGASVGTAYVDGSKNPNWSPSIAMGIEAYSNGWKAPVSGRYVISCEMRTSGAFLAGVAVNQADSANPTLQLTATAPPVQSIAAVTISGALQLAAGDIVRPYLLSSAGTLTWRGSEGFFAIESLGSV